MARQQRPTPPNEWLYKEYDQNDRVFASAVYLPDGEPDWDECTNEEKEQWEHEHQSEEQQEEE